VAILREPGQERMDPDFRRGLDRYGGTPYSSGVRVYLSCFWAWSSLARSMRGALLLRPMPAFLGHAILPLLLPLFPLPSFLDLTLCFCRARCCVRHGLSFGCRFSQRFDPGFGVMQDPSQGRTGLFPSHCMPQ